MVRGEVGMRLDIWRMARIGAIVLEKEADLKLTMQEIISYELVGMRLDLWKMSRIVEEHTTKQNVDAVKHNSLRQMRHAFWKIRGDIAMKLDVWLNPEADVRHEPQTNNDNAHQCVVPSLDFTTVMAAPSGGDSRSESDQDSRSESADDAMSHSQATHHTVAASKKASLEEKFVDLEEMIRRNDIRRLERRKSLGLEGIEGVQHAGRREKAANDRQQRKKIFSVPPAATQSNKTALQESTASTAGHGVYGLELFEGAAEPQKPEDDPDHSATGLDFFQSKMTNYT